MKSKSNWNTKSQAQAQEIMGKNFFGVKDAINHFGVEPTEKELNILSEVPYLEKVLRECKDTHILVAIFPLSILEIREKVDSKPFYKQTWYNDEDFAKEKGKVCWKLIRKTPVPDFTSKNWKEQLNLLRKDEEAPTARTMVYTIVGHYLKTGERLFEHIYVRTSSTDSDGWRVVVGIFDSGGLDIDSDWRGVPDADVGLVWPPPGSPKNEVWGLNS